MTVTDSEDSHISNFIHEPSAPAYAECKPIPRQAIQAPPVWGTLHEAADHYGTSTRTVRRRIEDGTIRAKRFGPRLIRVDMNSLDSAGRSLDSGASE